MKKYILMLNFIFLTFLASSVNALEIEGAVGEWKSTSYDYSFSGVGEFYTNDTNFKNNMYFYYDSDNQKLKISVLIPDLAVGTYSVPIYIKRAYSGTNNTFSTSESLVTNIDVSIISVPTELKEMLLPQNGLIPEGMVLRIKNFEIIPSMIGQSSVVFNTNNCQESDFSVDYGEEKTIICGSSDECNIKFTPEYMFTDTSGNNYVKISLKTNCYTYSVSIQGESGEVTTSGCGTISISVIGQATRGKTMLVHTTTEGGKDIVAKVVMTDAEGNTQAFQTNNPFEGYGQILIPQDADVPLILLASKEGCETGKLQINELKGQLIKEEEQEESAKKLVINNLPSEALVNSIVSGTLLDNDGNLITDKERVIYITDPDNAKLKTNTDSSGNFKFYAGKLGKYIITASLSGYQDSENYTVTVRKPRKNVTLLAFKNGEMITTASVGDIIDFGIYYENKKVDTDVTGKVRINGKETDIRFTNGAATYKVEDSGILRVSIPQTSEYNSEEMTIKIEESFNFNMVIYAFIIIVLIVAIIYVLSRKGGSSEPKMGLSPYYPERGPVEVIGKKEE